MAPVPDDGDTSRLSALLRLVHNITAVTTDYRHLLDVIAQQTRSSSATSAASG